MTNPKFTNKFVNYLIKLVPDNIRQELDFKVKKNKTGYIRLFENKLQSVYLICEPTKLHGKSIIKYKFIKSEFEFDNIYYSPDMHNEYRYNKNLEIDAIYLVDICILPILTPDHKQHYFEVLKDWEKASHILAENKDYISACQVIKNNKKVKLFYIVSHEKYGDKEKDIDKKTKEIINSITENFNVSKALYFSKGTYQENKVIKSDTVYLMLYDPDAEKLNNELNLNKNEKLSNI